MAKKGKDRKRGSGHGKGSKPTQFKPGESGFPSGRPKGAQNLKTIVQELMIEPVTVKLDGKTQKVSSLRAMLIRARHKALEGDLRALDLLLEFVRQAEEQDKAHKKAASRISPEEVGKMTAVEASKIYQQMMRERHERRKSEEEEE